MTQYTRSAIPGRAPAEDRAPDAELDRMVFGRQPAERAAVSEPDAPAPTRVRSRPASMEDDDAPPEHLFTERAPRERRRAAPRRKTDYAPLAAEAGAKAADASKRGPLILVVTLVVIGVFGAVVWNAYSSGLRAPDGGPTPELASAGPFKTRPAVDVSKPADIDASVFERVEKTPTPAVTQEVRPEAAPEPKSAPVKPAPVKAAPVRAALVKVEPERVEPVKVAPVKVEPVKTESVKAEPVKLEPVKPAPAKPTPAKAEPPPPSTVTAVLEKSAPSPAAASAPKPVAVLAVTPAVTIAKPTKLVETPTKPAAALAPVPAKSVDAAAPAPSTLEGAGAFHPAFTATGGYLVQLAAPSSEAAAQAEWARRSKAAPGLLGSAEKLVVKADVNGKTVYRLRAGSFATSADADAFCGAIKASGGACFTAKK